jgi:formylglycine-generating enzyme required for sulfatase activity
MLCGSVACVAAERKTAGPPGVPAWAKVSKKQIAEAAKLGVPVAFENHAGVRFVLVPAGEFMMGSPDDEVGRYKGEGPRHKVTIGKAFYAAIHQCTQGQWKSVMGTMPWKDKDGKNKRAAVDNPSHAINHVCWDDGMAFCAKLGKKDGRTYRLLTEAEWEYACRAGSTTRYCYGDDLKAEKLAEYAWYQKTYFADGSKSQFMRPVGAKKPNAWGVYDMHGNAWEFCMDVSRPNYEGAPTDGSAWIKGGPASKDGVLGRVLRGGGPRSTDRRCRTASRYGYPQNVGSYYTGFRIMCEVGAKGK